MGKKDGELCHQLRLYWSNFLDAALIKMCPEKEDSLVWSICLEALQMPRVTAVSSTSMASALSACEDFRFGWCP